MKAKSNEEIYEFLKPIADSLNIEIVEVSFKMAKNPSLTVYIDKEGGVDLDTCELFHNAINEPLDTLNPYDNPYTLNVSSPGLDRPFKTERDFMRNVGKEVEVKLYASVSGKKFIEGVLKAYDGKVVTVTDGGQDYTLPLSSIVKINKAIKFD
ncbi:MAG: ribosome maturation factor RimP [Clostridia bacterium]|nr:ribosome maturation factor RimP [Clostridia bacterium]